MAPRVPTSPDPAPLAGGLPLILCLFAGIGIGAWTGETSIGFLGGLGAGVACALAIWLVDRRRQPR